MRQAIPLCPITGEPAAGRIQPISKALLVNLWRWGVGVDVGALMASARRLGLWRSPCGLAFFDPMIQGDEAFYSTFYGDRGASERFLADPFKDRSDFLAASRLIAPGARVLDVGCGSGPFRAYAPQADYVGLEPNHSGEDVAPGVLKEGLEAHAADHAGAYDAVCAFHVIEHVSRPLDFARTMLGMVKPGGLLILAAPSWPSPLTAIPNMVGNAPPHHLSWWTTEALAALAKALDLDVVELAALAPHRQQMRFQWISRLSPVQAKGPFFASRWTWIASVLIANLLSGPAMLTRRLPRRARSMEVFLAARKPGQA